MNTTALAMWFWIAVGVLVFVVLTRRQSDRNKQLPPGTPLPTQWLKFYTNVRIPFGILYTLFVLPPAVAHETSRIVAVVNIALTGAGVTLLLFLFFGLRRRRAWGWRLNWVVLVLETLTFPIQRTSDATSAICFFCVVLVCWFWPNAVYFRKRRSMFEPFPVVETPTSGDSVDRTMKGSFWRSRTTGK